MKRDIRILILEDSVRDAELLERELRLGEIAFIARKVDSRDDFVQQLNEFDPDLIIADYKLPSFDGLQALEIVRERSSTLPFILVSGYIGEERATEALKKGATDFILKDRLGRLVSCVKRSLREAGERAEHDQLGKRFLLFVESAPNAMVMVNASGVIEIVNAQTERMFGFPREELLGRQIEVLFPDRFHADDPGSPLSFVADAPDRLFGLRRDATEFPIEIDVNPIETADGTEVLYVVVDISARRQIEREKDHQRQELERSNADLEGFAYIASHDLKAPLRAIGHLAQWIQEDIAQTASAETAQNLELLQGRVARLQMLLDGLLAYSRVGHIDSPVEDVDIPHMVREIATSISPEPGFIVCCVGRVSPLHTRYAPIRMVLENLIGNGLKHHDRAEGRITVAVRQTGGGAEFRVTDDGPGIAPRFHERIFVIFQTLAGRDEVEASGIGLAIVKRLVEGHGGRIWVESAPPARGATFVFTWMESPREDIGAVAGHDTARVESRAFRPSV
jgi:PAS domain S-box-containing protein